MRQVRTDKDQLTVALKLRMRPTLHQKLVASAETNYRSLNSEILRRLVQTFVEEECGGLE